MLDLNLEEDPALLQFFHCLGLTRELSLLGRLLLLQSLLGVHYAVQFPLVLSDLLGSGMRHGGSLPVGLLQLSIQVIDQFVLALDDFCDLIQGLLVAFVIRVEL